eukprot:TRINITY_DN103_c0_g1_i1.p1 TRINITY_DN103_c0_g1~~TRINITY_DN103_c0_g1_i1.p1  ORF type:complete len:329 (-),score=29.67 TRINITY_DN103_c0_g1_i1:147-1079(-)
MFYQLTFAFLIVAFQFLLTSRMHSALVNKLPTVRSYPSICNPGLNVQPVNFCKLQEAFHVSSAKATNQRIVICRDTALQNGVMTDGTAEDVPKPVVIIDNHSDPFATIVKIQFGDRLGELLDTMGALRNLGLNIVRAKIESGDIYSKNKFYITDAATSEKVIKSDKLEDIRLTILNNLLYFHPESQDSMAWGGSRARKPTRRDLTAPLGAEKHVEVKTTIKIEDHPSGSYSELYLTTTDRPGLLVDVVHTLKDCNVNVVSAEVDTYGTEARDEFYVTYHGEALPPSLVELVTNALQYYLSIAEVEKEESY